MNWNRTIINRIEEYERTFCPFEKQKHTFAHVLVWLLFCSISQNFVVRSEEVYEIWLCAMSAISCGHNLFNVGHLIHLNVRMCKCASLNTIEEAQCSRTFMSSSIWTESRSNYAVCCCCNVQQHTLTDSVFSCRFIMHDACVFVYSIKLEIEKFIAKVKSERMK